MASRDNFLSKCELWRQQINFLADDLGDVYDGRLWSELQVINGRPFLSAPNNLCLALIGSILMNKLHTPLELYI